jgi:hypothetical protein
VSSDQDQESFGLGELGFDHGQVPGIKDERARLVCPLKTKKGASFDAPFSYSIKAALNRDGLEIAAKLQ